MFGKIHRAARALTLMSCLTIASAAQVQTAHAAIGIATFNLPLIICGSVSTFFGVDILAAHPWHRSRIADIWGGILTGLGIVLLDDGNSTATLQKLSPEQGLANRLTPSELEAYNAAIENGEMDGIFQTANSQLTGVKDTRIAHNVMDNLKSSLDPDARSAFTKIMENIALRAKPKLERL